MVTGSIKGFETSYISVGEVVRKPALVTSSYVLCADHTTTGEILVFDATYMTLFCDCAFAGANYFEIKPVHVIQRQDGVVGQDNLKSGAHYGSDVFLDDLAAAVGSSTVMSASALFASWMVGHNLHLHSGTAANLGSYPITAFTSTSEITVDTTDGYPSDGTAALSSGVGGVAVEYADGSITTSSGVSEIYPSVYRLTRTNIQGAVTNVDDGGRIRLTFPVGPSWAIRLYVKGDGTLTNTSCAITVAKQPIHGE